MAKFVSALLLCGLIASSSGCALHGKRGWLRLWADHNTHNAFSMSVEGMNHNDYREPEVAHFNWMYNYDPGPRPKYRELYPKPEVIVQGEKVIVPIGPSNPVYPDAMRNLAPPLTPPGESTSPPLVVPEPALELPPAPRRETLPPAPDANTARIEPATVRRLTLAQPQEVRREYPPALRTPYPPMPAERAGDEIVKPRGGWLFSTR
ncbi:MAG: hypothetical protein CMJ48_14740 [Planctomycetaceae bacterium]|nr:hypothetical protein [Planctomycetaceae bacterium]